MILDVFLLRKYAKADPFGSDTFSVVPDKSDNIY